MATPIDLTRVIPIQSIIGEDEHDTELLKQMSKKALEYIKSFDWCPPIIEQFLGYGVGGVVAIFLVRFATKIDGRDDWLWVVDGDVPSAYLVADGASNASAALSIYCNMMDDWAHAVLNRNSFDNVFPVAAPTTPDFAKMLLSRTEFIREQIIPKAEAKL